MRYFWVMEHEEKFKFSWMNMKFVGETLGIACNLSQRSETFSPIMLIDFDFFSSSVSLSINFNHIVLAVMLVRMAIASSLKFSVDLQ